MKFKALLMSPLGLIPAGMLPANAADLPIKAPAAITWTPTWAGFYAGLNAGLVSERSSATSFQPALAGFNNWCWTFDCGFATQQTATGILGGVQIGYNFQSGNIVYGFEADFGLASAKRTTGPLNHNGYNWSSDTGIDALGTARLRLGYAFDRTLVYATGGLAYGKVRDSFQGDTGYVWSGSSWRAGYTVGGGLEYAIDRKWSVKAEGLYYDLGSKDHISTGGGAAVGLHNRTTGAVGRLGLNYLFH